MKAFFAEIDDHIKTYETQTEASDETISLYNVIVAQVGSRKFLLHKTTLTKSRYLHDKRKEVEGRDIGIGVWEEVFETQISFMPPSSWPCVR